MTCLGLPKAVAFATHAFEVELGYPQNIWSVEVEELGEMDVDERGFAIALGDEIVEWQELG